jgi:hypothetical protein
MPALLAIVLPLLLASPGSHAVVRARVEHVGRWTLGIRRDRFSGGATCRLYRHGVHYERGALVIGLPRKVDTFVAIYRLDDGPPVRVRDELDAMALAGFAVHADDLDNPSGGLVRVPEGRALDARWLRIEAPPRRFLFSYRIEGLRAAIAAARLAGCDDPAFDRPAP